MTTAIYTHPLSKLHQLAEHHCECPARIVAIENALVAAGLDTVLDYRTPPEATVADLRRVHTADYIDTIRENTPLRPDVYWPVDEIMLNMHSWNAALRAAGAGIAAVDACLAGEIRNAFCLMRPIGHHSNAATAMGFCVFNNVAIAAMHALKVRGLERVAIVDIDVHHGNGTEDIFANEPRAMMVSFYQQFLYPFCGGERRHKHMINVPMKAGQGGETMRTLVTEDWLPALHEYQPQFIFFSAGFDSHRDDPIGGLNLVEDDYAWVTKEIMAVADQYAQGRIVSFLEGGYNLTSLATSAVAHIQTLAQHTNNV
ncbi:MAG: histone deacetylase family protein [Oxalobacter sp.]|nr:MAG: histone deacetylase family protein [Oxalobacter sp.]